MRKLLLTLTAIAGLTIAANAQDFKPKQGSVTTEFGLYGGIINSTFDFKDEALLRFRYFAKENLAYRIGFGVGIDQNTDNVYGPNDEKGTVKYSDNSLKINLGVEKHFAGTERLSPYVGADLIFGTSKETEKGKDVTMGGTYQSGYNYEVKGPGSIDLGLRGVVGADYYIAKHLFLGAEAGLGFLYSKEGTVKTDDNGNSVEFKSPGSSFELEPSVVGAIRIGFVF